jgi:protein gp37
MGETTGIEWSDATWNPWYGCHKVSPACAHCYAEREMARYGKNFNAVTRAKDATFRAPEKWKEPRKIFTCSWSDFFIDQADPWRGAAWTIIFDTKRHTYQVLTKRPERIEGNTPFRHSVPDNCWLGTSVENSHFYWRIRELLKTGSRVHFLSIEPLLGPMPDLPLHGIEWVIVGGESGEGFRPLNLDWVRQIRDACVKHDIPFFFKQKSAFRPKSVDRLLDGREWNEFPKSQHDAG